MEQSEAELERFRREWREEVSKRAKRQPRTAAEQSEASESAPRAQQPRKDRPAASKHQFPRDAHAEWDEVEPRRYHDLEEGSSGRRLQDDGANRLEHQKEPVTALEHYEKAVEKEGQGSLGDSVSLYRKAFRLDARVHEKYKNKHFPAGPAQHHPKLENPNSSVSSETGLNPARPSLTAILPSVAGLIVELSKTKITGSPPPTDLSPPLPCPISSLPEEILTEILLYLAADDIAAFARLAQVCKRLAFLVMSEDSIWRQVTLGQTFGFAAMHYDFACDVFGNSLRTSEDDGGGGFTLEPFVNDPTEPLALFKCLPLTSTYPSYRHMFRLRPRIRFNGCYISTVNYTRPGASTNTWTWNAPVLIVTYFRYLRFFRDGTVISLLTTSEPHDVVPFLHKEHLHDNHTGNLPQAVMRDALRGRWRLSGRPYGPRTVAANTHDSDAAEPDLLEEEGDIHIETEGVVPRYMYKIHLGFASAGRGARNNKLVWKGYWSHNRLTDDWAEFGLKNDKAFYWSRVRSYDTWE